MTLRTVPAVRVRYHPHIVRAKGDELRTFYTIGHSSHSAEHFLSLLSANRIEVLVDTRSAPYSRYSPQFDREALRDLITSAGMKYLYLGDVVGGRPKDEAHYDEYGRARYAKMGKDQDFLSGIERLERGADEFRIALMCSEEDPAHCHRRLLIGRVLIERGAEVIHIRGNGEIQAESQVAACSGKALIEAQPALFAELDEDKWRSTASVSPKGPPRTSSTR
ncbi:MAG TPA: DUF488 domain-containing protein [Acidobacteriaceae bacterium]